jgi:hypothetical protein
MRIFFSVILSRRRRIGVYPERAARVRAERFSGVLAVQTGVCPCAACASPLRVDSSASLEMTENG